MGRYVTIQGQKRRFFGMITDVSLGVVDERINVTPSDASDPFLAEVLAGTSTFGTLHVLPMLTIGDLAEARTVRSRLRQCPVTSRGSYRISERRRTGLRRRR